MTVMWEAREESMSDPYEVLDVPRDATEEEVEQAWREFVVANHPDQGGSREDFLRGKDAYETIVAQNREPARSRRKSARRATTDVDASDGQTATGSAGTGQNSDEERIDASRRNSVIAVIVGGGALLGLSAFGTGQSEEHEGPLDEPPIDSGSRSQRVPPRTVYGLEFPFESSAELVVRLSMEGSVAGNDPSRYYDYLGFHHKSDYDRLDESEFVSDESPDGLPLQPLGDNTHQVSIPSGDSYVLVLANAHFQFEYSFQIEYWIY